MKRGLVLFGGGVPEDFLAALSAEGWKLSPLTAEPAFAEAAAALLDPGVSAIDPARVLQLKQQLPVLFCRAVADFQVLPHGYAFAPTTWAESLAAARLHFEAERPAKKRQRGAVAAEERVGMALLGKENQALLWANDAFGRLAGHAPEALIGLSLAEVALPPESKLISLPLPVEKTNGSGKKPEELTDHGRCVLLALEGALLRQQVRRQLRGRQKYFEALIERTSDLTVVLDAQGRVVYVSPSVQSILGYSPEKLRGHYLRELVHPDDQTTFRQALESSEELTSLSFLLFHEQGAWRSCEGFLTNLTDKPPVEGWVLNLRDTTVAREQARELTQRSDNLTALIENTDDIIYSLDRNLTIITTNSVFQRLCLFNFGTEVTVGTCLRDVVPQPFLDSWERHYRRAMQGERFVKEMRYALRPTAEQPAKPTTLEMSVSPIRGRDGLVTGVTVFGRDITERKRAANELKRTNFELDTFVYRASHDLRAPLRSLLGLVQLIRLESEEGQQEKYLQLIERSVNRLDRFIADLTDYSRNARLEVAAETIDFGRVVEECFENLRYAREANQVALRTDFRGEEPFSSDPGRLMMIMQNLLSNAIKYQRTNQRHPEVAVEVTVSEAEATIVVRDNGRGIQAQYLNKIFDMFFRATETAHGSGLGLYITRRVVEKLGGTISVASVYGEGSAFTVSLPNLKCAARQPMVSG